MRLFNWHQTHNVPASSDATSHKSTVSYLALRQGLSAPSFSDGDMSQRSALIVAWMQYKGNIYFIWKFTQNNIHTQSIRMVLRFSPTLPPSVVRAPSPSSLPAHPIRRTSRRRREQSRRQLWCSNTWRSYSVLPPTLLTQPVYCCPGCTTARRY